MKKMIVGGFFALLAMLGSVIPASAAVGNNEYNEVWDWAGEVEMYISSGTQAYYAGLLDQKNDPFCYSSNNSVERSHVKAQMEWFLYNMGIGSKSNTVKVEWIYGVALSRASDTAGRNYWVGYLNGGGNWQTVLNSMVFSGEFTSAKVQTTWDAPCPH